MKNKKINVGIDVRMINSSGIGVYIKNLIPKVIKLVSDKNFYLFGNQADLEKFDWVNSENVNIESLAAPIYSIHEQWTLKRSLSKGIDIFWSPHYNFPLFTRSKRIVTVHDLIHLAKPELFNKLIQQAYARIMFQQLKKKADKIICVSRFTSEELLRLTNCDPKRISIIHNGIGNSHLFSSTTTITPDHPYFLFVGNIKPHKNLHCLIEAFRLISEQLPHALYIIGSDEGMINIDNKAELLASQKRDRIFFKKDITDDQLAAYYKNAECLIFPSHYEGFGLPPLEAMRFKCPVISSYAASMPEVCGEAAIYFNPNDPTELAKKMIHVVNSTEIRNQLVSKGVARCKEFDWNKTAEKTAHEINTMIRT